MKLVRHLSLLILFGALAVPAVACEFNASTASIASATLAKGYNDGKWEYATDTFAPSDHIIHLVVDLSNAPKDTKVGATWYVVDTGESGNQQLDASEVALNSGENVAHLTLTTKSDWLIGTYKVVITLNGKEDRTLNFDVKE